MTSGVRIFPLKQLRNRTVVLVLKEGVSVRINNFPYNVVIKNVDSGAGPVV